MKTLLTPFTAHPASVGESYFGHMAMGIGFGLRMLVCGLACLVHAFLPFLFMKTGSSMIARLYTTMVMHRNRAMRTAPTDAAGIESH